MARRNAIQQAKDALAAELYLQGHQVREVAGKMGYAGPSSAHGAIQRGLDDMAKWKLSREETLTLIMASFHLIRRELHRIAADTHYLATAGGKIATVWAPDGHEVPVEDSGPKLRALAELRQLNTVIGLYADLKPASKSRVTHIEQDTVTAAIEKLEKDLAENDGRPARRRVRREP